MIQWLWPPWRLFERSTDEEARLRVIEALEEQLGHVPALSQRARNLIAIARKRDIRIEDLLLWIGYPAPQKKWSAAEFERWADRFVEARRELAVLQAQQKENEFLQKLCPQCQSAGARRKGLGWWCDKCGDVD
jgi:hypothetical protein